MAKWLRRLRLSQSGQGLIEYCLIISVVAVALTAVLYSLRNSTGNVYNGTSNSLDQAVGCSYGSSSGTCATSSSGASTSGSDASGAGDGNGNGDGHGGGNGRGNHGNGNGNGGGDGSNGKGGGKGNQP